MVPRPSSPPVPHPAWALLQRAARRRQHPAYVRYCFLLCGIFVVLPVIDLPFIGLSVTAPLILPVLWYAFVHPATPWLQRYRGWLALAGGIWLSLLVSFIANSPLVQSRSFEFVELAYLYRYLYWLALFAVTAFVASDVRLQRRLPVVLGAAVVVLAALRCFEGVVWGKIGAWTDTWILTQNDYGILFSTFTPMLFPLFLSRNLLVKLGCALGLIGILAACAINGSRGSWICITTAGALFGVLSVMSRPRTALHLMLPLGLAGLTIVGLLLGSPRIREAVLHRLSTFESLDKDKSYMIRKVLNQRSLKVFRSAPLLGVGPGRLKQVYVPLELPPVLSYQTDADIMRKSSHNSYLSFLAEGGLLAAVPLLALLGLLAVQGARAAFTLNRRGEAWALGVYAGFVGMSVHLWSLSGLTGTHAWLVYGLVAATIHLAGHARRARRPALRRTPAAAWARPQPVLSPYSR